eukprot:jgi/Tetstr1/425243/TSEL_015698.t1
MFVVGSGALPPPVAVMMEGCRRVAGAVLEGSRARPLVMVASGALPSPVTMVMESYTAVLEGYRTVLEGYRTVLEGCHARLAGEFMMTLASRALLALMVMVMVAGLQVVLEGFQRGQ